MTPTPKPPQPVYWIEREGRRFKVWRGIAGGWFVDKLVNGGWKTCGPFATHIEAELSVLADRSDKEKRGIGE